MEEIQPKYKCPTCERGILNRKVNRCLYCGASLPGELLFTAEKIAEMDERERVSREHASSVVPSRPGLMNDDGFDVIDAIDLASDIADLF